MGAIAAKEMGRMGWGFRGIGEGRGKAGRGGVLDWGWGLRLKRRFGGVLGLERGWEVAVAAGRG